MKANAKSRKRPTVGAPLSERLVAFQRTAEKQMQRGWDSALDMLPPTLRKRAKQLTSEMSDARRTLSKRGERLITNIRKATSNVAVGAEKRVLSVFTPVTRRLDVATRTEVDRLRKRIDQVEKRLHAHGGHTSVAA